MTTRHICMALAVALVVPAQTHTQEAKTASSFSDLQRILKVGDRVKVTYENGTRSEAKVSDVSASSLLLSPTSCPDAVCPRSQWTATEKTVTRIQRTDSLRNGTLIGLAAGAGGLVLGGALAYGCCRILGGIAGWAIFYGPVVGGVVDRRIGNEVIYRAPSAAKQAKLVVSPLLGRRSAGVSFSLGF